MTRARSLIFILILLAQAAPLRAQEELSENEKTLLTVVQPLQQAVQEDDRAAVAKLLVYPLDVWNGRRRVTVGNASQFLAIYDKVVDFRLKRTIARADVRKAFSNYQGFMFDRGRIWIGMRGDAFGIITINPPSMFEYGESIPFDTEDTLNFPAVIGEYLGENDGAQQFLFTGADGNATVSVATPQRDATFTVGASRYTLELVAPGEGGVPQRLILTPLIRHRHVAKR